MKKIGLFENSSKSEAIGCASYTAQRLCKIGVEVYATSELIAKLEPSIAKEIRAIEKSEFEKHIDILISFGGDGTMLSAAQLMLKSNIPIMGVNVGKLGFLAEYSIKDLDKALIDLIEGNYRVVDRSILGGTCKGQSYYALNDFVIEKRGSSRMITITAYTNEHYIGDYRADGLIITTPTGSTAYSLSCGGPILSPSTKVFCLTPIAPHSLTYRPLVIPDTNEIELKVQSLTGEANFVADGTITVAITNDDIVRIKKSNYVIKLVKPIDSTFYDLLRRKLLWAVNTFEGTQTCQQNNYKKEL